jgi:hypothetical protein
MCPCEKQAFAAYLNDTHALQVTDNWSPGVARWARLCLPNGQVAQSSWKELLKPLEKVRMACNVKVCILFVFNLEIAAFS